MTRIVSVLLIIFLLSCHKNEQMETTKHMNTVENTTSNIDSLWNVVVNKDGCLTGGQYSKNGKFGKEGCVMDNSKEWKALFEVQKYNLSYYLLSRLDKTDTTIVHTCPFFMASEGELAVYTLQRLYNKNWYDFDEFSDYLARSNKKQEIPVSNRDNLQIWLQEEILMNESKREVLKSLWRNEIEK